MTTDTVSSNRVKAVLFDLDGTFADTAPDMARALNKMLERRSLAHLPVSTVRPHVSRGARGMLHVGFDLRPEHANYIELRDEFYDIYDTTLCVDSRWFDGMLEVVDAIERRKMKWGIVTNKAARFAVPLGQQLNISPRAHCLVCGDSTPHTKPHPAPLLHAAKLINVKPENCLYVGDDPRDIEAAIAAGMTGVAAGYGYGATDTSNWGAKHHIAQPTDLLALLG